MKKTLILLISLLSLTIAHAQYYYQDIIGVAEINTRMNRLKAAGVKSITATGYDATGKKTSDFNEWQEVQEGGRLLKVTTRNGQSVSRQYYRFNEGGRLQELRDSSREIETISEYEYDEGNHLARINVRTNDSLQEFSRNEVRIWNYRNRARPASLLRILNGTDSSRYDLKIDEQGNVVEEKLFRVTNSAEPVYYYYDDQNRLTDIVRYNKRLKKLLPDVMFEYDEQNNIVQRITVLSTIEPDYLTWRYLFDQKGLKTKEVLFNRHAQVTGRIEYAYTFQ